MHFVDQVELEVFAGDGGNGCISFRREKYVPLGGPAGGDGGDGGSILFQADNRLTTLLDLSHRRVLKAPRGEDGRNKDQFGARGEELRIRVPIGTQVFDADSGELICDLDADGKTAVVAKGGRGGRGNARFATPWDRAPRRAEPGEAGERRLLRLELKVLADVGILGFPNVGKSTFIASVSRARPKIADYPFTTLVPNLGVVSLGEERTFVVADIPGIIEGASSGAGLGLRFLRHVERTKVLFHVLAVDPDPKRDPIRDFDILAAELAAFDPELASRPLLVGLAKADLPETQSILPQVKEALEPRGYRVIAFSSATRQGLDEVLRALDELLRQSRSDESPDAEKTAEDPI